jgi:ATPase subunit of ABC transporter with duplicated ATPase domains
MATSQIPYNIYIIDKPQNKLDLESKKLTE